MQHSNGLDTYLIIYNTERFHQSLDSETPESFYKEAALVIGKLALISKKKKVAEKKNFTSR